MRNVFAEMKKLRHRKGQMRLGCLKSLLRFGKADDAMMPSCRNLHNKGIQSMSQRYLKDAFMSPLDVVVRGDLDFYL